MFVALGAMSQTYNLNVEAKIKTKKEAWTDVKRTRITKLERTSSDNDKQHYFVYVGDKRYTVGDVDIVANPKNTDEFWTFTQVNNTMPRLKSRGMQLELRDELHSDAVDFISNIRSRGLEMTDACLLNYIRGLMYKLAPSTLVDGRPGTLNLFVVDSPDESSFMYSDGTLVLYTGLLAKLQCERDLESVLCREIAHYVLDHAVSNVNAAVARKTRAEFWASLFTGVVDAIDLSLTMKESWFLPGTLTYPMAQLSSDIASMVVEHGGMKYAKKQDEEAEKVATQLLEIVGQKGSDDTFVRHIASAVSSVAMRKYAEGKYLEAIALANRNMANGMAVATDYLLKANSLLAMNPSDKDRAEVAKLISLARHIDPQDPMALKTEILSAVSAKAYSNAVNLLQKYVSQLTSLRSAAPAQQYDSFGLEIQWAKDTMVRLGSR